MRKIAVITGADRGIGKEITYQLSEKDFTDTPVRN
jgi:NAD(P)-dependent dehydrogenase (short-subunit alcohol dehydrogenase family)